MNKDYEQQYKQLKHNNSQGWGGSSFEQRMKSWDEIIHKLQSKSLIPPPPLKTLELGSGTGDVSFKFARLGYEVSGAEISPTAVAWANEKAQELNINANFFVDDVCELSNFPDNNYGLIFDGNCTHCIIGEERKKLFKTIYNKLTEQGLFYISCMVNDPKPGANYGGHFNKQDRIHYIEETPYRFSPQKDQLVKEIKSYDFELQSEWMNENPWWQHYHGIFKKI